MSLYVEPHQARTRPPNSYERAMAAELEASFGRQVHDLPGLVTALNAGGLRPASGADWTEESLTAELARLGEGE
ncbi:recombinase-like helix-turn-helix domain-containing protein [Streptosporangium sp. NPDC049644]|uniref:recombinase-like helix-turn-helix domain-containing protein n=1 Tax=Streptosporangium sp. NPDC049644 TaxID=3155507 RepID=UPI00343182B6